MNLSLSGLNIGAQSAETLISGGIDFATPDALEDQAKEGVVFRLYDKPEKEWLAWAPVIRLYPQTNALEQAAYNPRP
jgi:paraquat-inducible protein B